MHNERFWAAKVKTQKLLSNGGEREDSCGWPEMRGRGEGVKNEGMGDRGRFHGRQSEQLGKGRVREMRADGSARMTAKEKNWEEFEGKDLVEGGAEQETRTVSLGDREIDD